MVLHLVDFLPRATKWRGDSTGSRRPNDRQQVDGGISMSNMKDEVVIKFYVSRFGRPDSKGIRYMTQILKHSIANKLTSDAPKYDHLVAKVVKESGTGNSTRDGTNRSRRGQPRRSGCSVNLTRSFALGGAGGVLRFRSFFQWDFPAPTGAAKKQTPTGL